MCLAYLSCGSEKSDLNFGNKLEVGEPTIPSCGRRSARICYFK